MGYTSSLFKPGHPQQDGRHERMHLTLKKETTKPAGLNFLQQQPDSMKSSKSSTKNVLTKPWT